MKNHIDIHTVMAPFLELYHKNMEAINIRCDMMQNEIDRLNTELQDKVKRKKELRSYKRGGKNMEKLNNNNISHQKLWKDFIINFTLDEVSHIMTNDVIYVMQRFIKSNIDNIPLTIFEHPNILYVYGFEKEEWTIFTRTQLDGWLSEMRHHILKHFLQWKASKEMESDLDDSKDYENKEQFMDQCLYCFQKIIGNNTKKENEFMFKWLCNNLKKI